MRVSGIAVKQRETEAKALRLFVTSSLIGSLVLHIGLLASGIANIMTRVPEIENEPIELTFIDPPTPEETKVPPKPKPPEPQPLKPQNLEPPKPQPEPTVPDIPETITNPQSDSRESEISGGSSATSEISEFKPQTPQESIVPETPLKTIPQIPIPETEPIEPPKPIQPPPQVTTTPQKPDPQPSQPTEKANEDLKRLLTQQRESRTRREFSVENTPIQQPQATQQDSEKLREILTEPRNPTENPKLETNTASSLSDASNTSPNIAANSNTPSRRRRRTFANNNTEVATAPTTPDPGNGNGLGSGTGDSIGDGDGRAACRRCPINYPSWAQRQGIEGEITVAIDTDTQGNVTNVKLLSSSGNSRLDKEHLKLAREWKLKGSSNGRQGVKIITKYVLE